MMIPNLNLLTGQAADATLKGAGAGQGFGIPTTIFGAPTGDALNAVGSAASIAGNIIGGIGAEQAGKAQAQGYMNNLAVAGEQAAQEMFNYGRQRLAENYAENRLIGKQQAAYGAAGVAAGGSPLDVMGDTNNQIKLQALNLAYSKRFAQDSANETGIADQEAAEAATKAGRAGMTNGIIGGLGNALKLAASIARM